MRTTCQVQIRPIFVHIVFICCLWGNTSAQDLKIRVGENDFAQQVERLTYTGFVLSSTPNPPSGCNMVRYTIPINPNYGFNEVGYSGNFTVISQNATQVIVEAEVTASSQNIQFDMFVAGTGQVCENEAIVISANVQYFNNGVSCGPSQSTDSVTIIPQYNKDYLLQLDVTNEDHQCIGGFSRYEVEIPAISKTGGYNLSEVKCTAIIKGDVIDVTMAGRSPLSVTNLSGCRKKVEWSFLPGFEVQRSYSAFIMVKNTCSCYQQDPDMSLEVTINGNDPCGTPYVISNSMNNTLIRDCCNTEIPVDVPCDKYIAYSATFSGTLCSGECTEYNYILPISNENNPFPLVGLEIFDVIPDGVIVTGFHPSYAQGDQIQICYTTNLDPVEKCETMLTDFGGGRIIFTIDPTYDPYRSILLTSGEFVETFRYKYLSPIPAWEPFKRQPGIIFRVEDGFPSLDDNTARFTATSPVLDTTISYVHPSPILSCETEYYLWFRAWNEGSQKWDDNESAYPQEIVRFQAVITNNGSGTQPDVTLVLPIPYNFTFAGVQSMTYDHVDFAYSTTQAVDPLPQGISVSLDPQTNVLTIEDLEVPPHCGNYSKTLIEFDVTVNGLTPPEAYTFSAWLNDLAERTTTVYVRDFYKVNSKVFQRCDDGQMLEDLSSVVSDEEIDLIFEIENLGNIPIQDIKIINERCRQGDLILDSGVQRGSAFEINYAGPPIPLNGESFQYAYTSSVDIDNLCSEGTVGSGGDNNYLVIHQDVGSDVLPGEKFQVVVPHTVSGAALLGQTAVSDFYWCLQWHDRDTGMSYQVLDLEITPESECPQTEPCEVEKDFIHRVHSAFDFSLNGGILEISNGSLLGNDRWYPLWNDDSYGGEGYKWGQGVYQHAYDVSGSYEVCVVVDHFRAPLNDQSTLCHCEILCETITIE